MGENVQEEWSQQRLQKYVNKSCPNTPYVPQSVRALLKRRVATDFRKKPFKIDKFNSPALIRADMQDCLLS